MNIKIFFVDKNAEPVEYKQERMGEEEYTHCELINGWVVITDRWGARYTYPSHAIARIETRPTHTDRGS